MTDHRSTESIRILLVEDNPGDVRLVKEAFRETDVDTTFHVVTNGDAAIEFLRNQQRDDSATVDLTLLDLNLPRTSGFDVLETIKEDPELTAPPVIVLTSSSATEDVVRSYELCANAYLIKPSNPDEFVSLGRAVEAFWFEQATLPPSSGTS